MQSVCAEHSAFFDATPGGQKARAALGADVAEVDRLFASQQASIEERRAATAQCRDSRRTLRAADRAVASVGKLVNIDAELMATRERRRGQVERLSNRIPDPRSAIPDPESLIADPEDPRSGIPDQRLRIRDRGSSLTVAAR